MPLTPTPPPVTRLLLFIFAIFSSHENPSSQSSSAGREHEMVGLSVILENCKDLCENRGPQIISKGSMIKPSSPTSPQSPSVFSRSENLANFSSVCGFLEICFLCRQKLLPGKDIYMYKGDKAFCSVECRYRQIFMDEEEISGNSGCTIGYNCSMAATSSTPSSSSSPSGSSGKKGRRNAFAY